MHWRSWPEGTSGRPCEQLRIFGCRDDAAEGGVDVSEVVLQRCHLLCILLCGEDLWGKLSQLEGKHSSSYSQLSWCRVDHDFKGNDTYLRPWDVDGDFIQSPYNCLRTWRSGEAAIVPVILTHVVLWQKVHQRERFDFSCLACGKDGQTQWDKLQTSKSKQEGFLCVCFLKPL